jgi:pentatricopeptide repeat protein
MPGEKWDYYIIISALTEFKKIEVAIKAFNEMSDKKLKIVWSWNYSETLKSMTTSANIEFLWAKYGQELVNLLQNSKWLIFPGEEDFWIVPIEAQASGKWVFAYRWGWLLETVIEWVTWEFFNDKNWSDFVPKFYQFDFNIDNNVYNEEEVRNNALRFSEEEFEKKIMEAVYN